jgi:hypothetical protein
VQTTITEEAAKMMAAVQDLITIIIPIMAAAVGQITTTGLPSRLRHPCPEPSTLIWILIPRAVAVRIIHKYLTI